MKKVLLVLLVLVAVVGGAVWYFTTYKMGPAGKSQMVIERTYAREYALQVVAASIEDYEEAYGA